METYDYIIIGAGSSGCVVAARLSEDPGVRVLLLEAGPPAESFWVHAPAGVGRLFHDPQFNWRDSTAAVPTLGGRTVYWPRGKALGGSSVINGMVYRRGHPWDFDRWAKLGNEGWSWADVLPYFRRSETSQHGANPYRGGDGPLRVTDPAVRHATTDAFIEAAHRIGIPRTEDLNGPPFEGVGYQQFTIANGRRHTTYKAFVEPVRHRRNLHVLTGAHVLRIVLEGPTATGVEVQQRGQRRTLQAAREVIVSAGSLNSPHLLMLSGIGDGAMLKRQGITPMVDTPGVGRNLQDHWFAPFMMRTTPDGSFNSRLQGWRKYLQGAQYLLTRGGFLALGSSAVSAYTRSSDEVTHPDLQLVLRAITFHFDASGRAVVDAAPGVSGAAVLSTPKSEGHVELTSPDPLARPAFHPNYLSDPDDIRRSLIGMRRMRQIMQTQPFASQVLSEELPGPAVDTDEQMIDYLKANGSTAWHQVGTCRMGKDPLAVVDAKLRVHGVQRLRVIDASIMPRITCGNTNAPAIMIGEKGSDLIRGDAVPARPVRL